MCDLVVFMWYEDVIDGIFVSFWQGYVLFCYFFMEEMVWDLYENVGIIIYQWVGIDGIVVCQVFEYEQIIFDDLM